MKILTPEDQIKHHNVAPMPTQAASRLLGKKQALMQIHDFMDSYQKEVIGKLAPQPAFSCETSLEPPRIGHCANDDRAQNPATQSIIRQNRAKLHKIWLAMQPSFRPKSLV